MKMTESFVRFVRDKADDDLSGLLLSAGRYPEVDVKAAVVQIRGRARVKDKLPSWYREEQLFYPSVLATEQCSSEPAALYKQGLAGDSDVLCDLTGGLGVDAFFFSQKVKRVVYVEKNEDCCEAARHNMSVLGVTGMEIIHGDAMKMVEQKAPSVMAAHVFYVDPSRRKAGQRAFSLRDCEPDLTLYMPLLLENGRKVIAKLSPMLDVTAVLNQLPDIREVHILSVKNECKELLIVAQSARRDNPPLLSQAEAPCPGTDSLSGSFAGDLTPIFCVNREASGTMPPFQFNLAEERASVPSFAAYPAGRYLYEPNVSILKAGAFKTVAVRFGLKKLHVDSHLYTSDRLLSAFPGRCFEIEAVIPFRGRVVKQLSADIPQANIAVRNFPLSVDELRKRTRIADGGDLYLFGSTLSDHRKVLFQCRKIG